MRIAVDTRDLSIATTGTHTYLRELLRALRTLEGADMTLIELKGMQWGSKTKKRSGAVKFFNQLTLFGWKQFWLPIRCYASGADVLICTDYFLPLLPCGAKKVVVFHDALFFDRPEYYPPLWLRYFKAIAMPAAHRADLIIAPSAFSAGRLLHHFPAWSSTLQVIYQGPKQLPEQIAISNIAKQVLIRLEGLPFFLHVGVFEKRKNLPFLLKAFAQLIKVHNLKLLLIGSSNGKRCSDDLIAINQTIQSCSLEGHVVLAGYLPDEDLAYFYRRALGYVFPSVYEGFGIPLLEAFHAGLPVAAASGSSLPEIAGEAALYFDPDDTSQLVVCLEQLLTNASLRAALIEKGKERTALFNWDRSALQLVQRLRSL